MDYPLMTLFMTDRKFKGPFEAGSEEGWGRR
jgi:hypothetical protein